MFRVYPLEGTIHLTTHHTHTTICVLLFVSSVLLYVQHTLQRVTNPPHNSSSSSSPSAVGLTIFPASDASSSIPPSVECNIESLPLSPPPPEPPSRQHTSAYVSTRQQTSAYVRIRQNTSAYVFRICSRISYISAYVSRHNFFDFTTHDETLRDRQTDRSRDSESRVRLCDSGKKHEIPQLALAHLHSFPPLTSFPLPSPVDLRVSLSRSYPEYLVAYQRC